MKLIKVLKKIFFICGLIHGFLAPGIASSQFFNLSKFVVHPTFERYCLTHSVSTCVSYGFTAAREIDFILSFSQVLPIDEWYWSERSAVFLSSGGSRESNFTFLGGLSIFRITISGLLVWQLPVVFPLGGYGLSELLPGDLYFILLQSESYFPLNQLFIQFE